MLDDGADSGFLRISSKPPETSLLPRAKQKEYQSTCKLVLIPSNNGHIFFVLALSQFPRSAQRGKTCEERAQPRVKRVSSSSGSWRQPSNIKRLWASLFFHWASIVLQAHIKGSPLPHHSHSPASQRIISQRAWRAAGQVSRLISSAG